MNRPLVSVIMPAYNAANYIGEAIKSVINQTYKCWELIIVDDGSTDNTRTVVNKLQRLDSRIKYFYQNNTKQGIAKNNAIQESSGEYLAFLDSDDLWLENKLELTLNEMISGEYSLIFTDSYVLKGEFKDINSLSTMGVTDKIYYGKESLLSFLESNKIPNLTVLLKREVFFDAGGFTKRDVAEDYEMWLKLLKNGCRFKAISLPLSIYRMHNSSVTAKDRSATVEAINILKSYRSELPEIKREIDIILNTKIHYWVSKGEYRTNSTFRTIIKDMYSFPINIFFYLISYILPYRLLTKLFIKLS